MNWPLRWLAEREDFVSGLAAGFRRSGRLFARPGEPGQAVDPAQNRWLRSCSNGETPGFFTGRPESIVFNPEGNGELSASHGRAIRPFFGCQLQK
jgi:hypothetical protein